MKYSTVTVLENCNIWSQHVTFLFNGIRASFNHSKPNRGIREHFFRTVVQSSKWAPESYTSIIATKYYILTVRETPGVERAIKQRSLQRVVVTYFGLTTVQLLNGVMWQFFYSGYSYWVGIWDIYGFMERKLEARWGYQVALNVYVYTTEESP